MNAQHRDFTPDRRLMDGYTEDDIFAAEEGILASILNKNELLGQCGLEPTDFSEDLHRTIFSSIQQLGLKLEALKLPMDAIVVDHAEKIPTGN